MNKRKIIEETLKKMELHRQQKAMMTKIDLNPFKLAICDCEVNEAFEDVNEHFYVLFFHVEIDKVYVLHDDEFIELTDDCTYYWVSEIGEFHDVEYGLEGIKEYCRKGLNPDEEDLEDEQE